MPSDDRVTLALEALRGGREGFLAALAAATDEIRGYLAAHRSTLDERVERLEAELGPFAANLIDARRLASLVDGELPADPATVEAVEAALASLKELAGREDGLFRITVGEGGSLHDVVAGALAEVGRAFAAARVVQGARSGRAGLKADGVGPLPFSRWTRGERRLAPPLVVEVSGGDLRAASLAEFLDGRQKVVLVVGGDCAPAPLVRLVTPGTFVLQTLDGAGLDRLATWEGPGVAALVPESAAQFVHDPAGGPAPWDRLTVTAVPESPPRRPIGGLSALQQAEELDLLRALATRPPEPARAATAEPAPAPVAAPAGAAPSTDPVDSLAAWILNQANLSDIR